MLKRYVMEHERVPRNLNFWYLFGSFSLLVFVMQIISGIWLAMQYTPTSDQAFSSIQHIMRDVRYGWLLRLMHTTGSSAFFAVIYLHMYRGLIYGSYQTPRAGVWLMGMVIYMVLLLEAFTGYVLPWGQMSYWGATVITSFVGAIPYVGDTLLLWLRGDVSVSGVTLHRFFALHVIAMPLLLSGLIVMHVLKVHQVVSNNPEGVEVEEKDTIAFYPYYMLKNSVGLIIFLFIFCAILFFLPKMGGLFLEANNSLPANPLQTPEDITPLWYMTPFYAMLRAVPNQLMGVVVMASAIALMFLLPWLDKSPVRSIRHKGVYSKLALVVFVICFCGLGYLGHEGISSLHLLMARVLTIGYFGFFLLMPIYTAMELTT